MIDRAIALAALAAAVVGVAAVLPISAFWKKFSYALAGVILIIAAVVSFLPAKPEPPTFTGITTNGPGSPGVMNGGTIYISKPDITDTQALIDIDSWIGELEEYQLQEEFDYVGTFRKNVDFLIKHHGEWNGISPISEHFILAHSNHCRAKQDIATNLVADFDPGYICLIFLTEKWMNARDRLHKYAIKASLPSDIKQALVQMEMPVDANMNAIGNLLEDAYRKEPDLIFMANNQGTKYFSRLLNTYRGQLLPLEPQAKKINALIAQHLQK